MSTTRDVSPLHPPHPPADPVAVVESFLRALADGDAGTARSLIADDIRYVNVGLPPIVGAAKVERVLRLLDRPGLGFDVVVHAIAADGDVVLTERTDLLVVGPVRAQFWVCGRFEVRDGRITLWRDAFDYLDVLAGHLRGAAAAVVPSLRARWPRPEDAPGR